MRIIELFAGIGACSKALKRIGADLKIIDAVEIDKYAMANFDCEKKGQVKQIILKRNLGGIKV